MVAVAVLIKTVEAEHIFARTFDLGVVARLDRGPDIRREKIGRRLVAIDRAERVDDLAVELAHVEQGERLAARAAPGIGRAPRRESVWQHESMRVGAGAL